MQNSFSTTFYINLAAFNNFQKLIKQQQKLLQLIMPGQLAWRDRLVIKPLHNTANGGGGGGGRCQWKRTMFWSDTTVFAAVCVLSGVNAKRQTRPKSTLNKSLSTGLNLFPTSSWAHFAASLSLFFPPQSKAIKWLVGCFYAFFVSFSLNCQLHHFSRFQCSAPSSRST